MKKYMDSFNVLAVVASMTMTMTMTMTVACAEEREPVAPEIFEGTYNVEEFDIWATTNELERWSTQHREGGWDVRYRTPQPTAEGTGVYTHYVNHFDDLGLGYPSGRYVGSTVVAYNTNTNTMYERFVDSEGRPIGPTRFGPIDTARFPEYPTLRDLREQRASEGGEEEDCETETGGHLIAGAMECLGDGVLGAIGAGIASK